MNRQASGRADTRSPPLGWITIHRLDAEGDREREEVLGVIAETVELEQEEEVAPFWHSKPSPPRRRALRYDLLCCLFLKAFEKLFFR
jgi:hypothetical protein